MTRLTKPDGSWRNKYIHHEGNGPQECARRRKQLESGKLSLVPFVASPQPDITHSSTRIDKRRFARAKRKAIKQLQKQAETKFKVAKAVKELKLQPEDMQNAKS